MKLKVEFMGVTLNCDVDFQGYEPTTFDDPGCEAHVSGINEALYTDNEGRTACLTSLIADWDLVEQFEDAVLEAALTEASEMREDRRDYERDEVAERWGIAA